MISDLFILLTAAGDWNVLHGSCNEEGQGGGHWMGHLHRSGNSHSIIFVAWGLLVLFKVDSYIKINFNSIASNHYGIAGYYSMRAMQQGLIVSLNSWNFKAES